MLFLCDKSVAASKEPVKILPKETAEPNLREYLTLYQCSDESPVKAQTILPKVQNVDVPKTQTIQIEVLKCSDEGINNKSEQQQSDVASIEKIASPPPNTPEGTKQTIRKSTPKSGSHVRALDFNLTPGQSSLTRKGLGTASKSPRKKSPSKASTTKISKSLFGSPSKQTKVETNENESKQVDKVDGKTNKSKQKSLSSWDADLRAAMGLVKPPSPIKKKKKKDSTKKSTKKTKSNLNKTEVDAETIEANLKEMDLEVDPNEAKSEVPDKELIDESTKNESTQESGEKPENDEDQSVFTVALINCNAKPRFKKKCNTDNNISKTVKITKVKEIKSLEVVPDSNNKLILSPSKLNANKRTLVDNTEKEVVNLVVTPVDDAPDPATEIMETKMEVEDKAVKNDEIVSPEKNSDNAKNGNEEDDVGNVKHVSNIETEKIHNTSVITPEMLRAPNSLPVTANRNLTPMLETPMKFTDTSIKLDELPKTPGRYSPSNDINTPMTKMLNEQLRGVDILSIPTPKFPLTPTLAFTPFNTKSPYPNRSTDYSTSSSYYHPSDCEQNKSLEALMEECRRLENKKPTPEKKINSPTEVPIEPTIKEKISSFNHNLIARKNLSLVKKDLESSSTSGESSSSDEGSSYTGDTDSSSSTWKSKNDTIVSKRGDTPYMLRPRKKEDKEEKVETTPKIVTPIDNKTRLEQSTLACKESLLKEIEEKRKRTIAKFKQGEKPPPKKKQSPPDKTTPIANRNPAPKITAAKSKNDSRSKKRVNSSENKNTKTVNKRKSKSPVKLPQNTNITIQERDILLHISSDEDQIKPYDVVETELLESSCSPTNHHPLTTFQKALDSLNSNMKPKESNDVTSDQEAKILVEGLKQRGIYLVPTKTTKKIDQIVNINREQVENGHIHVKNDNEAVKVQTEKGGGAEKQVTEFEIIKITSQQQQNNGITSKTDDQMLLKGEKKDKDNKRKNTSVNTKSTTQTSSESLIISNEVDDKSKPQQTDLLKSNDVQNNAEDEKIVNKNDPVIKSEPKTQNRKRPSQASTKKEVKKDVAKKNPIETGATKRSTTKASKKDSTKTGRKKPQTEADNKITENKDSKKSTSDNVSQLVNLNKSVSTESVAQNQNAAASTTDQHINTATTISSTATNNTAAPINTTATLNTNVEQDLNLTDSVNDVEVFDDTFYNEETINIVYDPNNTCNKTLKDYDLPISNKCFVVEVFGQEIEMSVTPFEMIFDISTRNTKEKVIILQNTLIAAGKKTSDKLNKNTNMDTNSPLSNLYSDCAGASYSENNMRKLRSIERRRNSVDHRRESAPKLRKPARSKSVDCNTVTTLSKIDENNDDITPTKEKFSKPNEKDNEIRDVIGVSPITKPSPRPIDDDLMNYAICGSERVENDAEVR